MDEEYQETEVLSEDTAIEKRLTPLQRMNEFIAAAPKLSERHVALRQACLSIISDPSNWYDWGGKLRMNDGAASTLLSAIGIVEKAGGRVWKEEMEEGGKYYVFYEATFVSPFGGQLTGLGSCGSDDPFVAVRYVYDEKEKKKVPKEIPAAEVAYDNVVKGAKANCLVNVVSALTGLKNATKEELAVAGCDVSKIEAIGFVKRDWHPTEKQIAFLRKMKATDEEIEACKGQKDVDNLLEKLRKAKDERANNRKESKKSSKKEEEPAKAEAEPPPTPPEEGSGDVLDEHATKDTIKLAIGKAIQRGLSSKDVEDFRYEIFTKGKDEPWTMRELNELYKWLDNPCEPAEHKAKMTQGSLV